MRRNESRLYSQPLEMMLLLLFMIMCVIGVVIVLRNASAIDRFFD